ncbi:MAG: sensor histidine kinase [Cellulomonas sp.]
MAPLATLVVRDAREQVLAGVEDRAQMIALLAARTDLTDESAAGVVLTSTAGSAGEITGVLDLEGRQTAGPPLPVGTADAPAVRHAQAGAAESQIDAELGLAIGAAPVEGPGGVIAVTVVTIPAGVISTRYLAALSGLGLLSLSVLVAAVLVGRSFARTIVDPVRSLDLMAQHMSEGDLEARASVGKAPPELRRLADTLNSSADDIQRLLRLEHSFAADASHQLRTPLAALRLRLENLELAGVDPNGAVTGAVAEVDRLTAIVNALLDRARSANEVTAPVVTDVSARVKARVATWGLVAGPALVEVHAVVPPAALAWAVPAGLDQVLDNLLSNALRASQAGGAIGVEVTTSAETVTMRVLDRGPGMGQAERSIAFRRFWRGPGARHDGGTGLGLPIAAELVRASGGTIELLARPGGGMVAEVRLLAAVGETAAPPTRGDG